MCGTLLADDSPYYPVCALQQALGTQTYSVSNTSSELRFEHYTVLQNAEGKPFELGRGGMGVTYKAFDVRLQRPAALKIINAQLFGNDSARAGFVREARAAASVRHQNVASVFHIGETGSNYYYAMELVEGESLAALIRRSGCLGTDLALDIVEQVAAGLAAIEKQHLVHRDIKPSNIMVSCQDGKLENVKIIDLGLAKGVAEENSLSTELGNTLFWTRQFDAAQRAYDRLIELVPDQPMLRVQRANFGAMKSGDDTELGPALAAVPTSMSGDIGVLSWRLRFALNRRDWQQAKELIEKMKGGEDDGRFGYLTNLIPLPIGCYSILLARVVVYAWTNELDLAFETLGSLSKIPNGTFYSDLKLNAFWTPLRKDPRFDKLLAELAPRD